jgi:hypothetical protein
VTWQEPSRLDEVGVKECDDYLKKMDSCMMAQMPVEARKASQQALKASKDAWRQAAQTEPGRIALKTACAAALEALASNPLCK